MAFVRKELTKEEKEKLQVYVGSGEAMVDEETGALFIYTGRVAADIDAPYTYELHLSDGMVKANIHRKMISVDDTFRNGYNVNFSYDMLVVSENIQEQVKEIVTLIEIALTEMTFTGNPEIIKSVTVSPPPLTIFYKPLKEMRTKYEIEKFNRRHAEEYNV